jgi:hypothetical protein
MLCKENTTELIQKNFISKISKCTVISDGTSNTTVLPNTLYKVFLLYQYIFVLSDPSVRALRIYSQTCQQGHQGELCSKWPLFGDYTILFNDFINPTMLMYFIIYL